MSNSITRRSFFGTDLLEPRRLFSAQSFTTLHLLGYDLPGASYKYRTSLDVLDNDLIDSGTTVSSSKLTIGARPQKLDGRNSTLIKQRTTDNATTLITALADDGADVFITQGALTADGLTINATLHDTRFGPHSMTLGKTYSDSGTMTGTVSVAVFDQLAKGTFNGTSSIRSELVDVETITVRGKTYANAVRGKYTLKLNGTLTLRAEGQTQSAPAKLTETQTFWAVPGVGVVRYADTFGLTIQRRDDTETVHLSAVSDLVSSVLPK